jgi:hypothetical protein
MTLVNRLILGGQHTPFWGGQYQRFIQERPQNKLFVLIKT